MRICIEGNIGSGKSSLLEALVREGFVVYPEPVHEWQTWLEHFYADRKRWAMGLQMKVLASFVRLPKDGIIERSPLSNRHVFAQMLYNQGDMTEKEWNVFRQYHDLVAWQPDAIVYIKASPEVCLERLRKRARPGEGPIDLEYLKKVDFHYNNLVRYADCPSYTIDANRPHADVLADALDVIRSCQQK